MTEPSNSSTVRKTKPDKLPRPEIGKRATEADRVFFLYKWYRYKSATALDSQCSVDQLWECCSSELGRYVYDSVVANTTSEANLLEAVKKLVVRAQNIQGHEKTIGSFSDRLRDQAAVRNSSCSVLTF